MLCFLLFRAGAAQTTVRIITFCILRLSHPGRNGTQGDGALQPLTLHFAGYRIGLFMSPLTSRLEAEQPPLQ